MNENIISAIIGAVGAIVSAVISVALIGWKDKSINSKLIIAFLALLNALLVASAIVYFSYDGTKYRIETALGNSSDCHRIVYEKVGLGFLLPKFYKIDDFAFRFGGGEIFMRRDYDPQFKRNLQAIQIQYMNVQDLFSNNCEDEVKNHTKNFEEIGAKVSVVDAIVGEMQAKIFYIKQPLPTGEIRDIEQVWVRLSPCLKLVVTCWSDISGSAAFENFKIERETVIKSIKIDHKKIKEIIAKL